MLSYRSLLLSCEEYEVIGKIKIQSFGAHKHNSTAEASKMGFYYHPPQHISRHPHTRINLIISINKKSMRHINSRVVFCIFTAMMTTSRMTFFLIRILAGAERNSCNNFCFYINKNYVPIMRDTQPSSCGGKIVDTKVYKLN